MSDPIVNTHRYLGYIYLHSGRPVDRDMPACRSPHRIAFAQWELSL